MELEFILPKVCVELQTDEIVGKGYWTHVRNAEWTWTFTKRDCANISWIMSAGASIASAVGYFCPQVAPYASVLASALGFGSKLFSNGAKYNGIRVYFHTMWWGRTPRWAQYI